MARRRLNGKTAMLAAHLAPPLATAPVAKRPAKRSGGKKRRTQLQLAVREKAAPTARRPFAIFVAEQVGSVEGATQQLRMKEISKRWKAMSAEEIQIFKDRSAREFASQRRAMASLGLGRVVRGPAVKEIEGAPPDLEIAALSGLAPVAADRQECTKNVCKSVFAGSLIAGFVVERQLGHGSYGSVYQATCTTSGRRVALKLGGLGLVGGEDASDFRAELDVYKMIGSHHLFLRCYGGGTILGEGSMTWLAMEMADGSLREHLRAAKLSEEDRQAIAVQVGAGLGFLHERQVCHLDVKSENIIWSSKQRKACLCDFGMSEPAHPSKQRYDLYCTAFNRPPELWEASNVQSVLSPAVDVWSFGLVLWEAASHNAARLHLGSSDFGQNVRGSINRYCCAFRRQCSTTDKAIEAARDAVAVRASLAPNHWRQVLFALCVPDPTRRPTLVQDEAQMLARLQSWQEQHFRWPARDRR